MSTPCIVAAARTPICTRSRGLAHLGIDRLAGELLRVLAAEAGVRPDGVAMGNCMGPGGNPGRLAALAAGFGTSCPGWGVDAQCGSGMVAIMQAADHVTARGGTLAAGGVESPSTAPVRSIDGQPYARAPFAPDGFPDPDMLRAAEDLAALRGMSRERQDEFARRSHELARGHLDIQRRETRWVEGSTSGARDDGPRSLTASVMRRFAPLFPEDGATVTPGNTARISDGAAAVILTTTPGDTPRTSIRSSALTGGDPALPGLTPVTAVREALATADTETKQLAAVEVVEAFAAQALATLDELGLTHRGRVDPRVNSAGGALALGHPWGASGALAVVRLHHRLLREPVGSLGVATCAIGGGMGAAIVLERTA